MSFVDVQPMVCPICGRKKPRGGKCRECRKANTRVREGDLRYWMSWAGVDTGCTPVKSWCRIHGVPAEIRKLAEDIWG